MTERSKRSSLHTRRQSNFLAQAAFIKRFRSGRLAFARQTQSLVAMFACCSRAQLLPWGHPEPLDYVPQGRTHERRQPNFGLAYLSSASSFLVSNLTGTSERGRRARHGVSLLVTV